MTYYHVYQARLCLRRRAQVNSFGWGAFEWSKAYINLSAFVNGDEAPDVMKAAVEQGLFQHTCDVEAVDADDAFDVGNIGPACNPPRDYIRFSHVQPSSMSVGNVLISADHTEGWLCLSFGWLELDQETIKWFETKVPTHIGFNKV